MWLHRSISNTYSISIMEGGRRFELTEIPIQVFKKILTHLDARDISAIRLTCSKLKSLIDTEIGFAINFDENQSHVFTKKYLKFIGRIAINEASVEDLLGKDEGNGMRSYFAKKHYFDDIFHFPLALKKITFKGKIHGQFLYDVLTKCHNLEVVHFVEGFKFEGDLASFLIKEDKKQKFMIKLHERSAWLSILNESEDIFRQIKMKSLRSVGILFRDREVTNSDLLHVLLVLKTIRSDVLEEATANFNRIKGFTEMEYFNLSMVIADLLQAHNETLTKIYFGIYPSETHPTYSPNNVEDILSSVGAKHVQDEPDEIRAEEKYSVGQKVEIMRKLRQKLESIGRSSNLTRFGIEVPHNYHWNFWLAFIENLQNLTTLHIIVSTRYRILKNCTFLKNSRKSLKRFRMNLDILNDFDFSGIEECKQLEEVHMFNKPISTEFIWEGPFHAHVKNVKLIPPGLKALCLGNVVVSSEDLNKMLVTQKALNTLVVMNMPCTNPENGTDCKFLKKVFRMRPLQSCLIQSFRCKTRKTYDRILEMLDFHMTPEDKDFAKSFDRHMGYGENFLSKILTVPNFDIVSPDEYCPYFWEKHSFPNGWHSHYSMRFNDDDPHLL